ncbi:GAF domain-containing SpoIIE family protein phosphatase [Actinoplanes sp. NPDC089786]|uniref:PP2C family protein-serine/threonine phosphatase n=1 Tax=Actinoplanes sp. NPDC089786 TaxID=3155185 RepID=UPI00341A995B
MADVEVRAADERLRRLEAVTDAALSHLDAGDLLDELLDRVRDLLEVDTVAVLLLDPHAQQLVATAAKGLEDEVRRGFRLAVGRGFAGRVAASRQPIALAEVGATDVVSPMLIEIGVRSLLGVPMLAGGELVGVLHVGSCTPRVFTDDDVRLLQLVADRAAAAGEIRAHRVEQTAALALQRSLLPASLPRPPGLDLAARFVPGHEFGVGGDWYDVFTLPSGWVGVVVGDVSGHGLQAAVVMGRIRSALRAYALVSDDPAAALTLLDRKVRHFETASLATVLYAMIAPDRDRVVISLAGHLPPVLARLDGSSALADVAVDPPAGVVRHRPRRNTTLPLPPGAVLAGYTDGLVERRDRVIDEGLDELVAAVRAGPSAEQVCAGVMTAIDTEAPTDDIALLVIRRCRSGS